MKLSFGHDDGRAIESKVFNLKKLGTWRRKPHVSGISLAVYTNHALIFARVTSSIGNFAEATLKALSLALKMTRGHDLGSLGRAPIGQLVHLVANTAADIRIEIALAGLVGTPAGDVIGVDKDYGRGAYVYDNFFGDPKCKPNPNLGPVARAPSYAVLVWPGDLGTGLLTDEFQRVVKGGGKPIPGLFAIGYTAASIMGRTYLGAGSTLGPAMTHAYIAVNNM